MEDSSSLQNLKQMLFYLHQEDHTIKHFSIEYDYHLEYMFFIIVQHLYFQIPIHNLLDYASNDSKIFSHQYQIVVLFNQLL